MVLTFNPKDPGGLKLVFGFVLGDLRILGI